LCLVLMLLLVFLRFWWWCCWWWFRGFGDDCVTDAVNEILCRLLRLMNFFRPFFFSIQTPFIVAMRQCELIYMNFQILSTVRLYSIWTLYPQFSSSQTLFLCTERLCHSPELRRKNGCMHWKNLLARSSDWQNPPPIVFVLKIEIGKRGGVAAVLFCYWFFFFWFLFIN
jgi:hypothetical protein